MVSGKEDPCLFHRAPGHCLPVIEWACLWLHLKRVYAPLRRANRSLRSSAVLSTSWHLQSPQRVEERICLAVQGVGSPGEACESTRGLHPDVLSVFHFAYLYCPFFFPPPPPPTFRPLWDLLPFFFCVSASLLLHESMSQLHIR